MEGLIRIRKDFKCVFEDKLECNCYECSYIAVPYTYKFLVTLHIILQNSVKTSNTYKEYLILEFNFSQHLVSLFL